MASSRPPPELLGGPLISHLECEGRSPTILAFHGFSSTPGEVELIVDVARELGCRARASLLPGHGSTLQALSRSRWKDWRESAQAALDEHASDNDPVIVCGVSMGALLALDLAAKHPSRVRAVVALAPALRLSWPFPSLALKLYCGLGLPDWKLRKKSGPDILDAHQKAQLATSSSLPAYAGNEVRLAGKRIARELGSIACPIFIAHGAKDHVSPVSGARHAYRSVATSVSDKELLVLPRSYHIITLDVERGQLRTRLYRFLQRMTAT